MRAQRERRPGILCRFGSTDVGFELEGAIRSDGAAEEWREPPRMSRVRTRWEVRERLSGGVARDVSVRRRPGAVLEFGYGGFPPADVRICFSRDCFQLTCDRGGTRRFTPIRSVLRHDHSS